MKLDLFGKEKEEKKADTDWSLFSKKASYVMKVYRL